MPIKHSAKTMFSWPCLTRTPIYKESAGRSRRERGGAPYLDNVLLSGLVWCGVGCRPGLPLRFLGSDAGHGAAAAAAGADHGSVVGSLVCSDRSEGGEVTGQGGSLVAARRACCRGRVWPVELKIDLSRRVESRSVTVTGQDGSLVAVCGRVVGDGSDPWN